MSEPIILTLTSWAEQHLETVFTAKTAKDFDTAFDALVAADATITVNGAKTTRAAYKKLLRSEEANETSGSVSFKNAGVNGITRNTSMPNSSASSARRVRVVNCGGWVPGRTTSAGCGSNVINTAGTPRAAAAAVAAWISWA